MEKGKRYFIVFYIGTCPSGQVTGMINVEVENKDGAVFLNKKQTVEYITEINNDKQVRDVVITGLHEMSYEEYLIWLQ